jgi:hypothetical protein
MSFLAPPETPLYVTTGDDDRRRRLRFRLWQVIVSLITVLGTTWLITLGSPLLSITAVAVAKHILVAVLAMGLDLYPVEQGRE